MADEGTQSRDSSVMLRCVAVSKAFGGVPVLKSVSVEFEAGTVTALAGENGAGKSTMMKIASGQYKADKGEVFIRGHQLTQGDTKAAHAMGLAIVPQELASIEHMAVYENLFVGRELRNRAGLLDRRRMVREARQSLEVFNVDINPNTRMGRLPVGMRQIVEIVKSTSQGAKVLLLDEPTSAIAEREVEGLFKVVRQLRDQGVAMVYTTHKMEEIQEVADRVVVLRDGDLVMDQPIRFASPDDIVTAMIGRELEQLFPAVSPCGDEVVLEVEELQVTGASQPVSLSVRAGEILGLAGLVGAGRTELLEGIFGIRETTAGTVKVDGQSLPLNTCKAAIKAGTAFVPEDRKGAGAVLPMSILDNGTLPRLSKFTRLGWLQRHSRKSKVGEAMESVRLRSRGLEQSVGTLSGGNQQKVVIARWLTEPVKVLLLDEPTRGVDVGARSEIYRIISDLAAQGMAVVMASSDMPEILGLGHRALVLKGGAVVAELSREDLDRADVQDTIFRAATGLGATKEYSDTVAPNVTTTDQPPADQGGTSRQDTIL